MKENKEIWWGQSPETIEYRENKKSCIIRYINDGQLWFAVPDLIKICYPKIKGKGTNNSSTIWTRFFEERPNSDGFIRKIKAEWVQGPVGSISFISLDGLEIFLNNSRIRLQNRQRLSLLFDFLKDAFSKENQQSEFNSNEEQIKVINNFTTSSCFLSYSTLIICQDLLEKDLQSFVMGKVDISELEKRIQGLKEIEHSLKVIENGKVQNC